MHAKPTFAEVARWPVWVLLLHAKQRLRTDPYPQGMTEAMSLLPEATGRIWAEGTCDEIPRGLRTEF